MPNRLSEIDVREVTLCKKGAVPDSKFLIAKSATAGVPEGKVALLKSMMFKAVNPHKQQVFGYVLVPDTEDLQGDVVTKEDIEAASHRFMKNLSHNAQEGTGTGHTHQIFDGIGYPIMTAYDPDGSIAKSYGAKDDDIRPGGWFVGTQITDADTWDAVQKGEITSYSAGGYGKRTPIENSATKKSHSAVGKVWSKFNNLITNISKQEGEDGARTYLEQYNAEKSRDEIYEMTYALQRSIFSIIEDETLTAEEKQAVIQTSVEQFMNAMLAFVSIIKVESADILITDIQKVHDESVKILDKYHKVNKSHKKGDSTMTDEEVKKLQEDISKSVSDGIGETVTKAIEGSTVIKNLSDKVGNLEKDVADLKKGTEDKKADDDTTDEKVTDADSMEKVQSDFQKMLDLMDDRISKIEKTPQPRKGTTSTVEKADDEDESDDKKKVSKAFDGTAFSVKGIAKSVQS